MSVYSCRSLQLTEVGDQIVGSSAAAQCTVARHSGREENGSGGGGNRDPRG